MPLFDTPIIIIGGPTASGKSGLAMDIALRMGGEIVNADSLQVYRHFNIGTAKPTPEDMARVPHHLFDIVEPTDHFDGSLFVGLADAAIRDIHSRYHLPVVVGGTGMYINFLLFGLSPSPPQEKELRKQLQARGEAEGPAVLYRELSAVDPEYAAKISPNDLHRIVRALEVYRLTGEPISRQHARHEKSPRYPYLAFMPVHEREELYRRIDRRVLDMMQQGFEKEVRNLLTSDAIAAARPMESLGYSQMARFIEGVCTIEEAIEDTRQQTRRYAKRQLTWFRNQIPGIRQITWPPLEEAEAKAIAAFAQQ